MDTVKLHETTVSMQKWGEYDAECLQVIVRSLKSSNAESVQ